MLDIDALVLAAMEASGGIVQGRTRLQKLVYFASELLQINCGYRPHYYGPYSSDVAAHVSSQVSRGVLSEVLETFATNEPQFPGNDGELRRYTYVLTPDGKAALEWHKERQGQAFDGALAIMRGLTDSGVDYRVLCYAAKLLHVLAAERKPLTWAAAKERARNLGWDMTESEVAQGIELLTTMQLVRKTA